MAYRFQTLLAYIAYVTRRFWLYPNIFSKNISQAVETAIVIDDFRLPAPAIIFSFLRQNQNTHTVIVFTAMYLHFIDIPKIKNMCFCQ